eukprot:CAMPEP_0174269274 /NCGR_PEP_ID=MMETSP0439-20130205/40431_1 /TAXON_ID=0 /ORGANISM="Stereomyxa ramosa, Strain Chinc5" /LENGTH=38 /DNA_ID= /DNA_START= /DNA_END= /DNA_ORIENTATION=
MSPAFTNLLQPLKELGDNGEPRKALKYMKSMKEHEERP